MPMSATIAPRRMLAWICPGIWLLGLAEKRLKLDWLLKETAMPPMAVVMPRMTPHARSEEVVRVEFSASRGPPPCATDNSYTVTENIVYAVMIFA